MAVVLLSLIAFSEACQERNFFCLNDRWIRVSGEPSMRADPSAHVDAVLQGSAVAAGNAAVGAGHATRRARGAGDVRPGHVRVMRRHRVMGRAGVMHSCGCSGGGVRMVMMMRVHGGRCRRVVARVAAHHGRRSVVMSRQELVVVVAHAAVGRGRRVRGRRCVVHVRVHALMEGCKEEESLVVRPAANKP